MICALMLHWLNQEVLQDSLELVVIKAFEEISIQLRNGTIT